MSILTATEAANVLRVATNDPAMLDLLPSVDAFIKSSTGRDWASDATINPSAKSAARMLLVQWYENPAMVGSGDNLTFGALAVLAQLEALAMQYRNFEGLSGAGAVPVPGARRGDTVAEVVGVVGVSGDQSASFEAVISVDGQLQQISSSDLSEKYFRARVIPLEHV